MTVITPATADNKAAVEVAIGAIDEVNDVNGNVADAPKPNWIANIKSVMDDDDDSDEGWIHPGILRQGEVTLFVGDPSAGKTVIALKLVDAIANGRYFLGHEHSPRSVLYIDRDGNGTKSVIKRMKWLGVSDGDSLKYAGLNIVKYAPRGVIPMPDAKDVEDWVDWLIWSGQLPPVIVIDSLGRFIEDGDENSAQAINKFWMRIEKLKSKGCTFLLLHHSGKGENTKKGRGSTAIPAGIDYGFKVSNKTKGGPGLDLTEVEMERYRTRSSSEFGDDYAKMRILISSEGDCKVKGGTLTANDEVVAAPATETMETTLSKLLSDHPNVTVTRFDELVTAQKLVKRDDARDWLAAGVESGSISVKTGPKNSKLHSLAVRLLPVIPLSDIEERKPINSIYQ
jgi:archaellum biogenesis ATPase FlaH